MHFFGLQLPRFSQGQVPPALGRALARVQEVACCCGPVGFVGLHPPPVCHERLSVHFIKLLVAGTFNF